MNSEIMKMVRKRKRCHRRAKQTNTEAAWSKFKHIRNETTKVIRQTKKAHLDKIIDKINTDNVSSKEWFKLATKTNQSTKIINNSNFN